MDYELDDRLKQVLESKIKKTSDDIHHELHNKAYNDTLQNEIRTLKWVLEYITQKKLQTYNSNNNNLEVVIQNKITDLTIRMDKAIHREVTESLFAKLETLRWILYVIHSINKGSLIVVWYRRRRNNKRDASVIHEYPKDSIDWREFIVKVYHQWNMWKRKMTNDWATSKKIRLEALVNDFQNYSEKYIKITKTRSKVG